MMISDEQVRRAVEYLQNSDEDSGPVEIDSDPGVLALVDRVVEALRDVPDVREDRVAHARSFMGDRLPSPEELAGKLIGRVVSDSIR
jgi:hypothetical protein